MKQQGFTLIEVMIALAIFAILASLSAYILLQSFHTDEHLKTSATRLHQLDMGMTLMRRETEQMINRPIRGNQQSLFPAFIGHADTVEFTRTGYINPQFTAQRSALKRVAYLCYGSKLIRRTWTVVDAPDRTQFHDAVLFDQLNKCQFLYADTKNQQYNDWRNVPKNKSSQHPPLPAAILCQLSFVKWGSLTIKMMIPAGLYDTK